MSEPINYIYNNIENIHTVNVHKTTITVFLYPPKGRHVSDYKNMYIRGEELKLIINILKEFYPMLKINYFT